MKKSSATKVRVLLVITKFHPANCAVSTQELIFSSKEEADEAIDVITKGFDELPSHGIKTVVQSIRFA